VNAYVRKMLIVSRVNNNNNKRSKFWEYQ